MPDPQLPSAAKPLRQAAPKVIDLRELMGSAQEIQLLHGGELYRLRVTKAKKLILTK